MLCVVLLVSVGLSCRSAPDVSIEPVPLLASEDREPEPFAETDAGAWRGAGGEWLDATFEVTGPASSLRVGPLLPVDIASTAVDSPDGRVVKPGLAKILPRRLGPGEVNCYRVIETPFDTNSAGYLRLVGGTGSIGTLPRALVPLPTTGDTFDLPTRPDRRRDERYAPPPTSIKLWLDLRLPRGIERGRWHCHVDLLDDRGRAMERRTIAIDSYGFDLPSRRSVAMIGTLPFNRLAAAFPGDFAGLAPDLLSRRDPRAAPAVERLDELMRLAVSHRLELHVPEVAPRVKWPAGQPPEPDWLTYDEVAGPWIEGGIYLDLPDAAAPLAWPVPTMDNLASYPALAQQQYWTAALSHFADQGWLSRSQVMLEGGDADDSSPVRWAEISSAAARIARTFPQGRIALPLLAGEVLFTAPGYPTGVPPAAASRLVIETGSTVTRLDRRGWPSGLDQPQRWLDVPESNLAQAGTLESPAAAVSEADVRMWGWLAFLREATQVRFGPALSPPAVANDIQRPADPARLIWFYPGELFGVDGPVPTVQLKWLRRAQQDAEYLHAARDREEGQYARLLARAMARPLAVEREPGDPLPDAVYALLTGTPTESLWDDALQLVGEKAVLGDADLRRTLPANFAIDHINRTTTWLSRREVPTPIVRSLRWNLITTPPQDEWDAGGDESEIQRLRLTMDIAAYNPSDASADGFAAGWLSLPGGQPASNESNLLWRPISPEVAFDAPGTYQLTDVQLAATARIDSLGRRFGTSSQAPASVYVLNAFRDSLSGASSTRRGQAQVVAPAVVVDQRDTAPTLDGSLGEWEGDEAIVNGPMIRLQSRPELRDGQIRRSDRPAQIFAAWTTEGLHLAFRFEGVARQNSGLRVARTFVEQQHRRAWGEDLAQIVVQPHFDQQGDEHIGRAMQIVLKPTGNVIAQQQPDRATAGSDWQDVRSNLAFATSVQSTTGVWRGELTIPWDAFEDAPADGNLPSLVRLNITHHVGETGESTSWAGPVDYGNDLSITGALVLRKPQPVGMN